MTQIYEHYRSGRQGPMLRRQYRAAEHRTDLDFDLATVVFNDQFGIAQVLASDQACLHTEGLYTVSTTVRDGSQFLVNCH
jgi:hypothetical protein